MIYRIPIYVLLSWGFLIWGMLGMPGCGAREVYKPYVPLDDDAIVRMT